MVGASLLILDCWLLFPYTDATFEQSGAIDVGCSHSGQLSNLLVAHVSYLNRPSFSLSVTREISTSGLFGTEEWKI